MKLPWRRLTFHESVLKSEIRIDKVPISTRFSRNEIRKAKKELVKHGHHYGSVHAFFLSSPRTLVSILSLSYFTFFPLAFDFEKTVPDLYTVAKVPFLDQAWWVLSITFFPVCRRARVFVRAELKGKKGVGDFWLRGGYDFITLCWRIRTRPASGSKGKRGNRPRNRIGWGFSYWLEANLQSCSDSFIGEGLQRVRNSFVP